MRARRTAAAGAAPRWSAHRLPFAGDEVLRHPRGLGHQPHRLRHGRWVSAGHVTGDCRDHLFTA
ncbi:hypothetical protein [Streptomyces sp. NPDC007984]|uniref:hypothetical protein n=1 Tax=Streptomyces sp. NPDC007984 TaxID=3364801 RepID=UPI0036E0B5FD